ncbi:SHOCT domain-containing protein [Sphingomonas echinoides]|uniref:SHOCT domain-containing protein n=1 Tax=Sphingomonas echinoides TaxID=59803 RepID=UPI002413BC0F|nr:SHOCT domain-containing protein [Sphingomonas echinoides]
MPDLGKLEQLNRLRESGALTQEEFDREKAVILAAGQAKTSNNGLKIAIAAAIIAAVIIVAILGGRNVSAPGNQAEQQEASEPSTSIASTQEAELVGDTIAPPISVAAPTPSTTLDWAFSEQIIGLNPTYIEGKLGPAKSKGGGSWEFDVKGCTVTYAVTGGEITSVSTFAKAGCQPKVMGTTITPQTTFAQLKGSYDIIRSSCIENCGNAADPTIELYKPGSHASNFIEVVYSSRYGDAQQKAMDLWVKAIRTGHGKDPDEFDSSDYEWFQCVSKPDASVVRALAPEQVGHVTIGRNLNRDGSCRFPS